MRGIPSKRTIETVHIVFCNYQILRNRVGPGLLNVHLRLWDTKPSSFLKRGVEDVNKLFEDLLKDNF